MALHRCFAPGIFRPAGGGEFDFSTLGFTTDLDARFGITVLGAGVSDWQDQGAGNLDATQGTDADRPADGGSVLGFNAIVFDRANTENLIWALTSSNAGTIFVVGQVGAAPSGTNGDSILGSGATGPTVAGIQIRQHSDTHVDLRISDGTTRVGIGSIMLAAGAVFIIGVRWDQATPTGGIRVNGNAEQSGTPPNAAGYGTAGYLIGKSTGGGTTDWDGKITRILAQTARLGDADFGTVFSQLNNIYGVF